MVWSIYHKVVDLGGLFSTLLTFCVWTLVYFLIRIIKVVQSKSIHEHLICDGWPTCIEWTTIFGIHCVGLFIAWHQKIVIKTCDSRQVRELSRSLRCISLTHIRVVSNFTLIVPLYKVRWPINIIHVLIILTRWPVGRVTGTVTIWEGCCYVIVL